jgi:putative Mn2+ efflux pump MntP
MSLFLIVTTAFALAMDAFAVAVGLSFNQERLTLKQSLRLSFSFGLFQFLMPILGWLAGQSILEYIQAFDHWVAFGMLFFIGCRMIWESAKNHSRSKNLNTDPTPGISLLILSIATSIDALAVGLSFSVLDIAIFRPAVIIGIVAFGMTFIGTKVGPLFGLVLGKRAGFIGGLILIGIGLKILFEHIRL